MAKEDPILEGRLGNLKVANQVRTKKSQFKEDLGLMPEAEACRLLADRLVNDPSGIMGAMSVKEVLLAINGIGKTKALMMAKAAQHTSVVEKVRDLPEFRRHALAKELRERAEFVETRRRNVAA